MLSVTLYLTNAHALSGHKEAALRLLSSRRRAAAEAMNREGDCLLQCAAGLLLRCALGVEDESVFAIGEYGKPSLEGGPCFSLSYAGSYAALAVADGTVGVDIEPLRLPDVLPRKVLTQEETAWLSQHDTADDFCLLWTRLESALKAEGCGLALDKRDFSLLRDGDPWYWDSRLHEGHLVTCAAAEPLHVTVRELSAETLLRDQ